MLNVWFSNRVAEVQDRMESWKRKSIEVHPLYHWPGESNVADLGTKGRAEARDVIQGSDWQDGPKLTRYPVERWPITRDFVRQIPEEEKIAKNNVGKLNIGNCRGHVEHGDVKEFTDNEMEHTGAVFKKTSAVMSSTRSPCWRTRG